MLRHLCVTLTLLASGASMAAAQDQPLTASRDSLFRALVAGKVLNLDRQLVHMSHTCSLRVDKQLLPVVDVQELVKGAATPRGVNRIVILDSTMKVVRAIEYTTERPLFCQENRLYVWGDLAIGNRGPEGNVLTFTKGGRETTVTHVDANDLPAPRSRDRKQPPQ
jgi:hypothetical protein